MVALEEETRVRCIRTDRIGVIKGVLWGKRYPIYVVKLMSTGETTLLFADELEVI